MRSAKLPRCGGYCRPGHFAADARAHALAALSPAQLRAGVETSIGRMLAAMCAVLLLAVALLGCKALRTAPTQERPTPSKTTTTAPMGGKYDWSYE